MEMFKVSIIVPIYNVEKYVRQCVESIIKQTYNNLEIILVNDGSTDESGKICDEFGKRDSRIIVIHQKNKGAANAKNAGLKIMSGDYYTFVDADDFISPETVEKMINEAIEKQADIVEAGFYYQYVNSAVEYRKIDRNCNQFNTEEYLRKYINDFSCSLLWNKLYKKTVGDSVFFKEERRCIDDEFYTYKVCLNANKIVIIGQSFYHYRQRKSSVMNNEKKSLQVTDDALEILIERYELVTSKFPKLKEEYLIKMIESLSYIASDFQFNNRLEHKYRKICKYCLKKSIKNKLRITYLYIICRLLLKGDFRKDNNVKKISKELDKQYYE